MMKAAPCRRPCCSTHQPNDHPNQTSQLNTIDCFDCHHDNNSSSSNSSNKTIVSSTTMRRTSRYTLLGPAWTRAFRCVWMLEEINASYEMDETALPQSERVRALVSSGKVPILIDHGCPVGVDDDDPSSNAATARRQPHEQQQQEEPFVLYESTAINTYLGEGTSLVPATSSWRQRALYHQTVDCINTELDAQGLWLHRKHGAMGHVFGEIPVAVKTAHHQFTRMNTQIAAQLHPYLLGENFTAADILYVHCLDWSKSIGWHDEWPVGVDEYRRLCQSRPAYQRTKLVRDKGSNDRRRQKRELQHQQQQQQQQQGEQQQHATNNTNNQSKL
jgi:glutathione S-transferase